MDKVIFFVLFSFALSGQGKLKSGPMVGYATVTEVAVWAQTEEAAKVKMKYWPIDHTEKARFSNEVSTEYNHAFTVHIIADDLLPGTKYQYEMIIDGVPQKATNEQKFTTQAIWKWRNDAPDFDFVAGSCFYINEEQFDRPDKPYGGDYHILKAIHKDQPDFMVWLGDNTYLREADWQSRSGVYHRYSHTRGVGELQALLASTHNYAIWDDHDYGPNDSDYTYYGKEWTLSAFKDFWANPVYGLGNTDGITGMFTWADADFFLMDNRWYRSPQSSDGEILGKAQLQWMIDALRYSNAKFKFICIGGQLLNNVAKFENHAVFARERQMILDAIDRYKIKGVIILDGDRHHSEISKWTSPSGMVVYDITSSALTSTSAPHFEEENTLRLPGSMIGQRNYAFISVAGSEKERKVTVQFKDVEGRLLFSYEIK